MSASRTGRSVQNSLDVAASLAPSPHLAPIVSVVVGILVHCENVRFNRYQILDLAERCVDLLYVLKDVTEGDAPGRLGDSEMVRTCVFLLESIAHKMISWINTGNIEQIVYQNDIAEGVWRCNQAIDCFLSAFQINSRTELSTWTTRFEESRRIDSAEALSYLADLKNNLIITLEVLMARDEHVKLLMAIMQKGLNYFPQGDRRHAELLRNLLSAQVCSNQLLPGIELGHEVRRIGQFPVSGSAGFDIWEGEYLGGAKCVIKIIRGFEATPSMREQFVREVKVWRSVYSIDKGAYILPCLGLSVDSNSHLALVTPWMELGDATAYLKIYPNANRKAMIRRIAEGLGLLHRRHPPIVHGDLRAANILIDNKGNPLLANFSLYNITETLNGAPLHFAQTLGYLDDCRWCAPELLDPSEGDGSISLSPAADVYAFAMTALELLTGEPPFAHIRRGRPAKVLMEILRGERPRRPEGQIYVERGLDDAMWALLRRCWADDYRLRPSISEVLERLSVQ